MLKNFLLLLLCYLIHVAAFSQVVIKQIDHYLLPEFAQGVVLMRSGERHQALLNYNSLSEEMIFDTNGKKLALTNLEQVDTVYMAGRKFFLLHNKFVEVLLESKYHLYVENKCSIKDPGKPAPYGGTSHVSSTDTYSSYLSGGQVYEMKLPEGVETSPYVKYWIQKEGKTSEFVNLRQLTKLFPEKSDLMKQYIKKQGVNFDNQASLVDLIKYLAAN